MDNNIVTIIVPCYNCEEYIEKTLDSFKAQTFKNFVVIFINDGSTDNTLSILQRWKRSDFFQMDIIDKKNEGVSVARNKGIEACNSEYIAFCDSDDLLAPTFLEKLLSAISIDDVNASYCLLTKKYKKFIKPSNKRTTNRAFLENQYQAMDKMMNNMGQISFDCIMYKTKILKQYSITFCEETKYGEDREFMWKYLCHCKIISFVDDILYFYRQNPHSATKAHPEWNRTDLLLSMKRVEEHMEKFKCDFLIPFKKYMFARCVWSVAKDFARSGDKMLYTRFLGEYDVKNNMRITKKDKSLYVKLSSYIFLVNPSLFFLVLSSLG